MYHDEFAKRPARATWGEDEVRPSVAVEVGGGLSMALAAGLDQSISFLFLYLGGLLPLVASSFAIAGHRASERLARWTAGPNPIREAVVPAHPKHALAGPMARARARQRRSVTAR